MKTITLTEETKNKVCDELKQRIEKMIENDYNFTYHGEMQNIRFDLNEDICIDDVWYTFYVDIDAEANYLVVDDCFDCPGYQYCEYLDYEVNKLQFFDDDDDEVNLGIGVDDI